jgi:hypothetical protein
MLRRVFEYGGQRNATKPEGSDTFRHEHLEGELCQRAGWHDQQVLAPDQILHVTEETRVEPVGTGVGEGKRFAGARQLG